MINSESETNPLRKIPTRTVPPTSTDIGSILRSAREKKDRSLDAVSQHTRISKRFLEAMEANRLEEFPAVAYLRGFLKCYCEYLELDFEPLWKAAFPEPVAAPEPAAAKPPERAPHQSSMSPMQASTNILPLVFLGAGIIILAVMWSTRGAKTAVEEAPPSTPAALSPVSAAPEPRLLIDFKADSWVRVTADGEVKFEGRVPRASRQDWKAKKTILLRASDPADLTLTLNGAPLTLPAPEPSGDYRIETP